MKFAALALAAAASARTAFAQSTQSCLGEFSHTYEGDCSITDIKSALSVLIAGNAACSDVDTELSLLLGLADPAADVDAAVVDLCAQAFREQAAEFFPFSNITMNGDTFDREFLNGGTFWNQEYEAAGENMLSADAYHVPLVHDMSFSNGIGWPTNPAISSVDSCTQGAAMCCYVSDRQKDDEGGDCATDECYFAEPEDNTDICYVDMANSPASARVANGIAVFDKVDVATDAEGSAFCHGFAWDANDDTAVSSRYKGNLLMSVAFKENTYDKGYVQNVPGAPMCGCVEKMPVVSNAGCTDLAAVESWTLSSDGLASLSISFASVDITYGDCGGVDLADKVLDLGAASDIRQHIVGTDNCPSVIDNFLGTQGLKRSTLEISLVAGHPRREKVYVSFNKEVADSAADVNNFSIENLDILSAELDPNNKATVILTTSLQTLETEYTVTVEGLIQKRIAPMVTATIGSTATFFPAKFGFEDTVGESADYTLVYELDIPDNVNWKSDPPEYIVDQTDFVYFSRIAYYMELESELYGHEYVWVSMPAFTQDVTKIGVPTFASGAIFQETLPDANVFTNQPDIAAAGSLIGVEANLEFWPNNYGTTNRVNVPGADNGVYDFGDDRSGGGDHGSMQVHVASAGSTLFAINDWNRGRRPSMGIGNQPSGHPDWTFNNNAASYTTKKLFVLVVAENGVPSMAPSAPPSPGLTIPQGAAATVPDSEGYKLVYDLTIPNNARYESTGVPYDRDYSGSQEPFERIAYFMELEKNGVTQWVWVSMKAFTTDATKIGVPTFGSGAIYQEPLYEMNIYSSDSSVVPEGTNVTGNIEFWPNNYGAGNKKGVPGASSSVYDLGDDRVTSGNYGSMQVHANKKTLFAFNDWNRGAAPCVGIGNQPSGHPDWTFTNNAASYTFKELLVFVK